ncbi:hypothetical protein BDF14DRAFT_1979932 [Spinellus fusiger]|nr:hypothetical protein BDF14DRAFT_1979932 [Spinellus fusiger]
MLPNSRIIPSPPKDTQRHPTTAVTTGERKTIFSRMAHPDQTYLHPSSSMPNLHRVSTIESTDTLHEIERRHKPTLSGHSFDDHHKKTHAMGGMRGFGKLFKKLSMATEDGVDTQPHVRPIPVASPANPPHGRSPRMHHNIPLAPPPPPLSSSSATPPTPPTGSTGHTNASLAATLTVEPSELPETSSDYSSCPQYGYKILNLFPSPSSNGTTPLSMASSVSTPILSSSQATLSPQEEVTSPRWSVSSTRKSSGSYSVYSTFAESYHSDSKDPDAHQDTSLLEPISRTPSRHTTACDFEETSDSDENGVDSDDDDDNDDDDVFVDATDLSQEDVEREKKESRLSKRLSGGHFGSAGGLMLSCIPPLNKTTSHRNSRTPEDLATAMLNWKRHSGTGPKRPVSRDGHESVPEGEAPVRLSVPASISVPAPVLVSVPMPVSTSSTRSSACLSVPSTPTTLPPPPPSTPTTLTPENKNTTIEISKYLDLFLKDTWTQSTDSFIVRDPRLGSESPIRIEETRVTVTAPDAVDMSEEDVDEQAKVASRRLWEEDATFVTRERMAEWLGQPKPLHTRTLFYYLNNFQFTRLRLDSAFRKLCSKLYFKAEAQQIDRILEIFAHRYWECNPNCIFGSADVVYAVVYSLLLLNTDLHVAQGNYARMTRQAFIKNTMSTIHEQLMADNKQIQSKFSKTWEADMELGLKDMYLSVKQNQILQPLSRTEHILEKRSSILSGKRVTDMRRSVNGMMRKSGRESMYPDDLQLRPSVSANASTNASIRTCSPPRSPRRESFSSMASGNSLKSFASSRTPQSSLSPPASLFPSSTTHCSGHTSNTFVSQAPYIKEGVLMRKHLLENANQKSKHREWREVFLTVSQGEMKMYSLQTMCDSERHSMLRASNGSFTNFTDSLTKISGAASLGQIQSGSVYKAHKCVAYSQPMGTIPLNHSLSNVLPPPGYNRQRPHVFAIQQPHGGVYLFQTTSQELANEWVSTCNYWAARESKEPLAGGVSNMEYGWGACLKDVISDLDTECAFRTSHLSHSDNVQVYDWQPPTPPMVASALGEKGQWDTLQKHLSGLNREINDHREIKKKMVARFPMKSQNYTKAMNNWELKSKYMLHEIIKYQNYCDALENSVNARKGWQNEQNVKSLAANNNNNNNNSNSNSNDPRFLNPGQEFALSSTGHS